MGFFDDLKVLGSDFIEKSSVVAKEAAQKAQDAAEMAKIKLDIAAREKEIKDIYARIGKAYYEANKESAVEFAEDVAEINAKFETIAELQSRYAMFKDNANVTEDVADEEDTIDIVTNAVEVTADEVE